MNGDNDKHSNGDISGRTNRVFVMILEWISKKWNSGDIEDV